MTAELRIRTATRSDVEGMVTLLHQLFCIEQDFTPNPDKQRRGLLLLLNSTQAALFVTEEAGLVVAMLTVQIKISTAQGGPG